MKKNLILFSVTFVSIFAHADCLNKFRNVLRERDHMIASMLKEEAGIIKLDRSVFYLNAGYGESYSGKIPIVANPFNEGDEGAALTVTSYDLVVSPILIAAEYVGNPISSTTEAVSRKISASDLSEVYSLLIEANIGEGKNLQSFVQDIKSENAVNVTSSKVASILSAGNSQETYCSNGFYMNKNDIHNSVLIELGAQPKN